MAAKRPKIAPRPDFESMGTGEGPEALAVDRYPTLETRRKVEVGQEFSVAFSLTEELVTPEVRVPDGTVTPEGKLRMDLPDDGEAWTIDVVMFAEGFSFRGPDAAKIRLPRQGNSAPALFRLIADPIASTEEVRTLHVTLWHKGAYLARVAQEIRVVDPAAASQAGNQRVSSGEQREDRPPPSEAIPLDLGLKSPELTVILLYGNAGHVADVVIDSPWLQPQRHRFQLPADTADRLRGYYSELSRKGRGVVVGPRFGGEASPQPPSAHTVAYAKGFGRTIYERLAPEPFKNAF